MLRCVKLQQELGRLLVEVGAVSSALEVYLRLQSWENVIACYSKLGHRQKVRSVYFHDADIFIQALYINR